MEVNATKLGIGGFIGLGSYLVGNINYTWCILAILAIVDFITGIVGAYFNDEKFDKKKCMRGGIIKVLYFVVILITILCDYLATDLKIPLAENKLMSLVATIYFIGTEGLSLIKNLGKIGFPIPPFFMKFFENLNKESP